MPLAVRTKGDAKLFSRRWRLSNCYYIRDESRRLVLFKPNFIQRLLIRYAEKRGWRGLRIIIDKARKEGVSTFWLLVYLDDTIFTPNTTSGIVAHKREDVQKLFKIVRLAYKHMPTRMRLSDGRLWVKPTAEYDNKNELAFESINSRIYVALESRGDTNNNLHISEAAYITNPAKITSSLASVPPIDTGSNITIESTGEPGGWFEETWNDCVASEGAFDPLFFAWFDVPKHSLAAPSGFAPTAEEAKMRDAVLARRKTKLTDDQLFWWRETKKQQKKRMGMEFPTFPEDSFFAAVGMIFDEDRVKEIAPRPPIRIWRKVLIWKEPVKGRRYIVSGDPAEGVSGDYSALVVIDAETLEVVAAYRSNTIKPAKFAKVIARVAKHYNNAVAAVELNNHGHTVLDRLKDIYGNIYMKTTLDEKTGKKTKKLGWETNSHTRDLILDKLEELVGDGSILIFWNVLKSEMMTFVTDSDGHRAAKQGCHDDTVMALAIAVQVASMPKASFALYKLNY